MRQLAESLVGQAREGGVELTGDNGLLTQLIRQVLQAGLNAELTEHVGYEPHAVEGRGSGNSRVTGATRKRLRPRSVKSHSMSLGTATAASSRSLFPKVSAVWTA
jgi:transposase-like protein